MWLVVQNENISSNLLITYSKRTMFTLVQFVEDDIFHIVPSKKLTVHPQGLVKAPYKRLGYYEARIIDANNNKTLLQALQRKQEEADEEIPEDKIVTNEVIAADEGGIPNEILSDENTINTTKEDEKFLSENDKFEDDIMTNGGAIDADEGEVENGIVFTEDTMFIEVAEEEIVADGDEVSNDIMIYEKSIEEAENVVTKENQINTQTRRSTQCHKKHCCYFCGKKIFQIVRHWTKIHTDKEEVRNILNLNKTNPVRRRKIDLLRRKGDFEYNKKHDTTIVARVSKDPGMNFVPCPSCLGFFASQNLRHHRMKCSPNKGSRNLQGHARALLGNIHEKASEMLKNLVIPHMNQDEITQEIIFDEIVIIYGNYLCIKYTQKHLINHIRARLRLLGRLIKEVKAIDNSINNCKELIHSKHIDVIRTAIDNIAELDEKTQIYAHPTNARTLSKELKRIIQVVKSESDRNEDEVLMKRAKGLSRRWKQELAPYINRLSKNSENKLRRMKQNETGNLPESAKIDKYFSSLLQNIAINKNELEKKFSVSAWTNLSQYLMVYLAAFNRKRPGETQRLEMADFDNRLGVKEKDLKELDLKEKIQASKYERIAFKGKLGNSTALLVEKFNILPAILLLNKYRKKAGVHPENDFLFAKPSKKEKYATFDAYRSHTQFCANIGLNPGDFTFTKLRKQFATEVAKTATSQEEEHRVSTYMSHDFNIHKKVYDHSAVLKDITQVSKHLEGVPKKPHSSIKRKRQKSHSDSSETSLEELDINYYKPGKNLNQQSTKMRLRGNKNNEKDSENCDSTPDVTLEEVELCLGKFQNRKLWTSLEKQTTRDYFETEIMENLDIDRVKIVKFKKTHPKTMRRPVAMIKQWLEGEKTKRLKNLRGEKDKRPRYSTPEKELLMHSFGNSTSHSTEPSLEEIEILKSQNDIYKNRSAESMLKKFRELQNG